ncbi:MAG: hypothetical protein NTX75_18595 [Proteobacteria bacterium]|nr:hypothetical protein [Pseudomonadota bacterium]
MPRHGGGFKSEKRKKELFRLKKQEEKRQRRFTGQTEKEVGTEAETVTETEVETETKIETETTDSENQEKDIQKV